MEIEKPNVGAIVLAAGRSQRFGDADKLLHELDGTPIVESTCQRVAQIGFAASTLVGSNSHQRLKQIAIRNGLGYIENPDSTRGIGSSIGIGVSALPTDSLAGIAIFLGDMPFTTTESTKQLLDVFFFFNATKIVRPTFEGQPGHPVVFPSPLFAELAELTDDNGARPLIKKHQHLLEVVESSERGCIRDIDSVDDLTC